MTKNKLILTSGLEYLDELDKKYPDRHKFIHQECCKNCPSNNDLKASVFDPETEDFKKCSKEFLAKEVIFVCAWRPSKLCKGICNIYNIDQDFLDKLHSKP